MRVPLLAALLLLFAGAVLAALVPAGVALDRRVTHELRRAAVEDLGRAPMILEDRRQQRAEALSMHAANVAHTAGLAAALQGGRVSQAAALARSAARMYNEDPVLVNAAGDVVLGPRPSSAALAAARDGKVRIDYVFRDGLPWAVGLVGLRSGDRWLGAAGSSTQLGMPLANTLAGLARADVVILGPDGQVVATTLAADTARALSAAVLAGRGVPVGTEDVLDVALGSVGEYWVARGGLGGAGTVLFARSVAHELAALPGVRRGALASGLLTLLLALAVGALVSTVLTRPVRALATAAERVSAGDFDAPVPGSRVEEVDRLGRTFRTMRESLRNRLDDLAKANRELEDGQRRLSLLQAELIRQDRLSSSARMAAELAHEIRNPVANVRNCLEVVRRGLPDESEGVRFADMAIDELLRMHELAEHLLDLNRPADPSEGSCDPATVADQVAALAAVAEDAVAVSVRDERSDRRRAAIAPDALKQVLFNLVDNAREVTGSRGRIEIRLASEAGTLVMEVLDDGPGIPRDLLPRLFDPFFTTKGAVHGVGLGLFVAEGLARRYGGRMDASNRTDTHGARFRVELPMSREGDQA